MKRARAFLLNPLVVFVPLMGLMWIGWNHYLFVSRGLSLPTHSLLDSNAFAVSGPNTLPTGWRLTTSGRSTHQTGSAPGYIHHQTFVLKVGDYKDGDVTLASPLTAVEQGKTYVYKGYDTSTAGFDLLANYHYKDGSSQLTFVRHYAASNWTTNSVAFRTGDTIRAVQFVYRFTANGSTQFDTTYLEENSAAYVAAQPAAAANLIPNGALSAAAKAAPAGWSTYQSGVSKTTFSYHPGNDPYVGIIVDQYKAGEAKWQYQPQPIAPGHAFHFSVAYQSTVPAEIVAEYTLHSGQRQFVTLGELAPAGAWATYAADLQAPAGANALFVSVVLHRNGTLNTAKYMLSDTTRLGTLAFKRPLVSVTFDGGWASAYTGGAAVLDSFGYKGTFYISPATIDTQQYMTTAQLGALNKKGDELASNSYQYNDLTMADDNKLGFQLKASHDYLDRALGVNATDFAAPFGNSDAVVRAAAQRYYASNRGTSAGINTRQDFDAYELKVLDVGRDTSLATVQTAITQAQQANGWLILVYHEIGATGPEPSTITAHTLTAQLALVAQANLTVKTVHDALVELSTQR